MIVVPKVLFGPLQLTDTATALCLVPANGIYVGTRVVFTNVDTVTRLVTVNLGRAGAAAATTNILIDEQALNAGEAWVCTAMAGLVLTAGDIIYGNADALTAVNAVGSAYATQ